MSNNDIIFIPPLTFVFHGFIIQEIGNLLARVYDFAYCKPIRVKHGAVLLFDSMITPFSGKSKTQICVNLYQI